MHRKPFSCTLQSDGCLREKHCGIVEQAKPAVCLLVCFPTRHHLYLKVQPQRQTVVIWTWFFGRHFLENQLLYSRLGKQLTERVANDKSQAFRYKWEFWLPTTHWFFHEINDISKLLSIILAKVMFLILCVTMWQYMDNLHNSGTNIFQRQMHNVTKSYMGERPTQSARCANGLNTTVWKVHYDYGFYIVANL